MKVCTVEFKPSFTSKLFIIILENNLIENNFVMYYFHFRCHIIYVRYLLLLLASKVHI